jgi:hypothetical protein
MHIGRGVRRIEVHYLDFLVDGQSLKDLVGADGLTDLVTPFCRWKADSAAPVEEFIAHPAPSRTTEPPPVLHLYVCALCGDEDCGALMVRHEVGQDTVTWAGWSWVSAAGTEPASSAVDDVRFARDQYEEVISSASAALSLLPVDESWRYPRRPLWPWEWGWRLPRRQP